MSSVSHHHSFDIFRARKYGIEEAILIQHFQFWIQANYAKKINFLEGRTWMYQTYTDIAAHFPYLTYKQVRRAVNSLVKKGVLLKNNFNRRAGDNTIWFSFVNEDEFVEKDPVVNTQSSEDLPKRADCFPEGTHRICPNGQASAQMGRALPDTKTDIYIKNNACAAREQEESKKDEPKKAFRDWVHLTDRQHEALISKHGEEMTDLMLDILDAYNEQRQKEYASNYGAMKKEGWVYKKATAQKQTEIPIESKKQKNEALAKKVVEKLNGRHLNGQIEALSKHLEITFNSNTPPYIIGYQENGFEEQLRSQLGKMGIFL